MSREIATVHGGDVFRLENSKVTDFVPIVEMAPEARQALHRVEGRFETVDEVESTEPAEIARGNCRQEIHAEIRG